MSERERESAQTEDGVDEARERAEEKDASRVSRIPGRDPAGASYASTEREQTADHRLESERYRLDDTPRLEGDEERGPRDAS